MAEDTRLDRLWRAVAETGAEADWLRFYEGFAAARLFVPVEPAGAPGATRLKTVRLEAGEVAFAFDTDARFTAFITAPTDFVALTGAALARALAPRGTGVALNPGVAPGETVLDAAALGWVAAHAGVEVTRAEAAAADIAPPVAPDEPLLAALGARVAEMGGHVAEAWLVGTVAKRGRDAYLCVVRPAEETAALADEIAEELTRIGQIRSPRPFAVAVVRDGARLLTAARRHGIGLSAS